MNGERGWSKPKVEGGATGREGAKISVQSRRPEGLRKCQTPD